MTAGTNQTMLVTGASGHLGRRVIELLLERQAGPIIGTTRHPDRLKDLAARGVEIRRVDFDDDPERIAEAFVGTDRMLLVSTDALDRPGRRFEQHERAINAGLRAGVRHIVYTSLSRPEPDSPVLIAPDHYRTEAALDGSGLGFTALRNNLYTDLLLMSLPQAVASGRLVAAAGTGGAAYVTREDCARAAAAALASDITGRQKLEVTGPHVVTQRELASLVGELTGRPVSYVAVDPETLRAGLVEAGMPRPVADLWVSFDVGMAQGLFAPAARTVADLTGHEPTSVREFLKSHRVALMVE